MVDDVLDLLLLKVDSLNVLIEIAVHIVEYQLELVFSRYNLSQVDDVWVLEPFEERYLSDGCRGDAFVLVIEPDLFYRHDVVGVLVPGFVDDSVGAFTDFVDALVAFGLVGC